MDLNKFLLQIRFFLSILLLALPTLSLVAPAAAVTYDDLNKVEKELEVVRQKQAQLKDSLKNQSALSGQYGAEIVTLNHEIQTMQLNVEEKQLVIDELDLKIAILEEQIQETEEKIEQTELEIFDLQAETDKRLSDMYLDIKSFDNSVNMIFASEGSSDFIKDGLYREAIQQDTNDKLNLLTQKKENLNKDKEQLRQDRIQVETDKSLLEEEKKALENEQTILSQKKNKYESLKAQSDNHIYALQLEEASLSTEEKAKLAERERIRQQLFQSISRLPNGTPINGPGWQDLIIGMEGETGAAKGVHLHFAVYYNGVVQNPCSYLSAKSLRTIFLDERPYPYTTCGVTNPKLTQWPMKGDNFDYTSPFGPRWGKYHYAIDLSTKGYNLSSPIYAAHPGYLSYAVDQYGGKYAVICENTNCNIGLKTIYLHLQ